jgi:hypothetical protein
MAEGVNVQTGKRIVSIGNRSRARYGALPSVLVLGALPLALSACAHAVQEQHGRDKSIIAESYGGRIEAALPASVPVPAARAAAEQTLRSRGYVITETFGTDDHAKVQASGTGDKRTDTTSVEAWRSGKGTRLSVDSGLFGDVAAARSILDETIARLGR